MPMVPYGVRRSHCDVAAAFSDRLSGQHRRNSRFDVRTNMLSAPACLQNRDQRWAYDTSGDGLLGMLVVYPNPITKIALFSNARSLDDEPGADVLMVTFCLASPEAES